MRIHKIDIERFRGIKKLSMILPSPIQLVAGANNSGKSTLIKALDLFFSGIESSVSEEKFKPKNRYYKTESSRALTKIKIHFQDFTAQEKLEFKAAIGERSQSFWCQIKISRLGKVTFEASQNAGGKQIYDQLMNRFCVFHIPVLRVSEDGFSDVESERYMTAVSDVLIRNRPGPKSSTQRRHEDNNKRFIKLIGEVLNDSKKEASSLLPSETDISFNFPDATTVLKEVLGRILIKSRPSDDLTLLEEGTGYQSLLSLGLLSHVVKQEGARRNMNVLILLEEPEAFLHPQYQRKVVSFINEIVESSQVIISTHSTIIVDAIDVENIMRLERMPKGLVTDWNPTVLSEKQIGKLSRWCDAKNSELIFADKVIFCEGVSDANVLKKIFDLSEDINELTFNTSIIAMDSRDNADKFVEMVTRFKIPAIFIFDKDVHSGNRSSLKKVASTYAKEFSNADYAILDNSKAQAINSLEEGNRERNRTNEILSKGNMFAFSSDVEGAIVSSYERSEFLDCLETVGVVSNTRKTELLALTSANYIKECFEIFGSKGWEQTKKNDKLKPHLCGEIVGKLGIDFVNNSDLAALKRAITDFLKE